MLAHALRLRARRADGVAARHGRDGLRAAGRRDPARPAARPVARPGGRGDRPARPPLRPAPDVRRRRGRSGAGVRRPGVRDEDAAGTTRRPRGSRQGGAAPAAGALGGRAPVSVRENTAVLPEQGGTPERSRATVLVDFDDGIDRRRDGRGADPGPDRQGHGARVQRAHDRRERPDGRDRRAERRGGLGPRGPPAARRHRRTLLRTSSKLDRPVWKKLKALPRAEQLSRIKAMHAAALSCKGDAFAALNGGASR